MKIQKLVFFVSLIVIAFVSSGCVVTAAQRMMGRPVPVPAGITVQHNVDGVYATLSTNRHSDLGVRLQVGERATIPVYGLDEGGKITVNARFFDLAGRYVGTETRDFYVRFYDGRFSADWTIDYFRPIREMSNIAYAPPRLDRVDVTNNIDGVIGTVSTSRGGFSATVKMGETVWIPVGARVNEGVTVYVKFYDTNGAYVGMTERLFYGGRNHESWVITRFERPTDLARRW